MVETVMTLMRPGLKPEKIEAHHLPVWPGYHALKALLCVDGMLGADVNLEHVSVLVDNRRHDMFVDDMGLVKGLARNPAATKIYRAASMWRNPEQDPEQLGFIAGPAILFSRPVWS